MWSLEKHNVNNTPLPQGFDFTAQPSINKLLVTELMRGAYLDQRESIILIGNAGTGKTHLATALGIEACGQGKKVRFWRITELITQLIEAREERQLLRLKNQLAKLDLLTQVRVHLSQDIRAFWCRLAP